MNLALCLREYIYIYIGGVIFQKTKTDDGEIEHDDRRQTKLCFVYLLVIIIKNTKES